MAAGQIDIFGKFHSSTAEGILAVASEIKDEYLNKTQAELNLEFSENKGGVSSVAGLTGDVLAADLLEALNIDDVVSNVSVLMQRTNWDDYFGIDQETGAIFVKPINENTPRGFYSLGYISAGGVGSSQGGGGEGASLLAVWRSLTNNNSLVDSDITSTLKIATEHIPDVSSVYGYLKGNQTITLTGVVTGSGTTTIATSIADGAIALSKISGLGAAATYGIGSVESGDNGLVTGGAVYSAIASAVAAEAELRLAACNALSTRIAVLEGMFEIVDGNIHVKNNRGFYSDSFITAGGVGSGGSGGSADLNDVWLSLSTNEDEYADTKIDSHHIRIGSGLELDSNGAIKVTALGGVTSVINLTGNITKSQLQTALELGAIAYKNSLSASDIPNLNWSKITSGKPTTIAGFGITDAYTKTEVNNLIGAIDQFHYEIAASTSAVTNPQPNVLYLIGPTGTGADKYEEYVYANSTWTKIGDTSIDLSGYKTINSLKSKGDATTPVYFDSNGDAQTITSYGGNSASASRLSGNTAYSIWGVEYWSNGVPKSITGRPSLYIGTTQVQTTSQSQAVTGVSSINGVLTFNTNDITVSKSLLPSGGISLGSINNYWNSVYASYGQFGINATIGSNLSLTGADEQGQDPAAEIVASDGVGLNISTDDCSIELSDTEIYMNGVPVVVNDTLSCVTQLGISASGNNNPQVYFSKGSNNAYFRFENVGTSQNPAWALRTNVGIVSDSFITAGGVGSGGVADLNTVWDSLTNNTDKPNVEINSHHLPRWAMFIKPQVVIRKVHGDLGSWSEAQMEIAHPFMQELADRGAYLALVRYRRNASKHKNNLTAKTRKKGWVVCNSYQNQHSAHSNLTIALSSFTITNKNIYIDLCDSNGEFPISDFLLECASNYQSNTGKLRRKFGRFRFGIAILLPNPDYPSNKRSHDHNGYDNDTKQRECFWSPIVELRFSPENASIGII